MAARMAAGNVCINDCIVSYAVTGLPFGGVKDSGIGRVHGAEGLREFSNVKSVLGQNPKTRFRILAQLPALAYARRPSFSPNFCRLHPSRVSDRPG